MTGRGSESADSAAVLGLAREVEAPHRGLGSRRELPGRVDDLAARVDELAAVVAQLADTITGEPAGRPEAISWLSLPAGSRDG